MPPEQTQTPGPLLQDMYYLGLAYLQSTPPDLLNCTWYVSRFVAFAPEPYKTQMMPTAKYCYKKYHGADDGYDAVLAAAQTSLDPPADFRIKPAPKPEDMAHDLVTSTRKPICRSWRSATRNLFWPMASPKTLRRSGTR